MRILWICNIILPSIAKHLNKEANVKEGWITGLCEQVLFNGDDNEIELGVCFPVDSSFQGYKEKITVNIRGKQCTIHAYAFVEDTTRPDKYDKNLESQFENIFKDFEPDLIHCFGTEYPHTLAAVKVCPDKNKILLGIQGICFEYAKTYLADLPWLVCRRFLLRDFLRWDNIMIQQKKFYRRGDMEIEALKLAKHVTGRTEWDKRNVLGVNPGLKYHFMNETLRPAFYSGRWTYDKCRPHSIFLSQGDYPIKGLHYVLWAMPEILEKYPDAHVYVAGQSIIKYGTLKEKLKISSYGKYLISQIKRLGLDDKITFLGRLDAEEMKKQYLESHVFLCPSTLENSPNSLGEAMILGVPCVAGEVGGIPSLFSDKEGILYKQNSAKALAEAIIEMWKDDARMHERAANARARALCNHDADSNYHTLVQVYRNICQGE